MNKLEAEVSEEAVEALAKLLSQQIGDEYGRAIGWDSFSNSAQDEFRDRARKAWPGLLQVVASSGKESSQ